MDLSDSIIAKSDQQNAADYLSGPRTFTIESVTPGTSEQPVNVNLVEAPGKPYKPSKSMRRVLVALWGKQSTAYIGRRITLYLDPKVKFGGIEVGGIKIGQMSHIDQKHSIMLTATQKTKAAHSVAPLIEQPARAQQAAAEPTVAATPAPVDPSDTLGMQIAECQSVADLKALYADYEAAGADTAQLDRIKSAAGVPRPGNG